MPNPSILIGFGAYGLRVLRAFLAGAATRGALTWDEETRVGSLNERRLKALSLFWIPDTFGANGQRLPHGITLDEGYELMDDVFRQIVPLEGGFEHIPQELRKLIDLERTRLLDAGRTGQRSMPQLDVFCIAQPSSSDSIGLIRNLTEPAMNSLAADPSFQTAQGSSLLNFAHIFDFEDYWSESMSTVRMALRRFVEEGSQAVADGRPAAGLTYLFDGNTPAGRRSAASRQQEVVLFIEFLLLENIRSIPDAQIFFQRPQSGATSVCSIGIRAIERSSGTLKRLAAAAFAGPWLEYLDSGGDSTPAFSELIEKFRGDRLDGFIGEQELRSSAWKEIQSIEQALLAMSPGDPDWADSLEKRAAAKTETAISVMARLSAARGQLVFRDALIETRDKLEATITAALQRRSPQLTLGAVICELRSLEDELRQAALEVQPPEQTLTATQSAFEQAEQMQAEYTRFLSGQVQTGLFKEAWWPRAAIVFALGASPVLLAGLSGSPLSNAAPAWLLASVSSALLGLLFWFLGRSYLHPALALTAERGRGFYTDSERGRISERIRLAVQAMEIGGRIQRYADLLISGLKQQALDVLADQLHHAQQHLTQRRNEARWLHDQVREFLRSNQVDDSGDTPVFLPGRASSDVRFSLEGASDLADVASTLLPVPGRFRDETAKMALFTGWSKPFCDRFLHPMQFLDQLSESFSDKAELSEFEAQKRARKIVEFLERDVRLAICFRWLATDGLPVAAQGCLIPTSWKAMDGVEQALAGAGFQQHQMENATSERLYIYEYQIGIPARLLVPPTTQVSWESA